MKLSATKTMIAIALLSGLATPGGIAACARHEGVYERHPTPTPTSSAVGWSGSADAAAVPVQPNAAGTAGTSRATVLPPHDGAPSQ